MPILSKRSHYFVLFIVDNSVNLNMIRRSYGFTIVLTTKSSSDVHLYITSLLTGMETILMVEMMLGFSDAFETQNRWLNLINLDHLFACNPNAVILNRLPFSTLDSVRKRNEHIFSRPGVLSFIAHCVCGQLRGNINVGSLCSTCGSVCRDDFSPDGTIEHEAWLAMPQEIKGVLHPTAYMVLASWLGFKKGVSYIDIIIDPLLDLPPELQGVVTGRGHNYFYDNFDMLMAYFVHYFRFVDKKSKPKREAADFIEQFIACYRSAMFCTKLPVLSAALNALTSADGTGEGRQYADADSQIILDAMTDLQQVEETTIRTRPNSVPSIVHRIYKSYITYVQGIAQDKLSRKPALIRNHMLGTRFHWTFRSVIIPHSERYDEIYLPWQVSVNLLRIHIIGRLVRKYGIDGGEAVTRQVTALLRFDPLVDQIMNDLIKECRPKFSGLPVLFCRNPSLRRGSVQMLYVTRIKRSLEDKTINISTLVLKAPNADFDGDNMTGILLNETEAAEAFYVLHPSQRIRDTNSSSISDDVTLPKQSTLVLNHFLQSTL